MNKLNKTALMTAAVLSLGLSACVKQRPDQYADGTVDLPEQVSDVQNTQITIHTAPQAKQISGADALRAENQGTLVAVDGYKGPDQYGSMFKDLTIHAKPNSSYEVHFAVDPLFLTAYMEMDPSDASALSPVELQLAKQFGTQFADGGTIAGKKMLRVAAADAAGGNMLRVPLFQYAVKDYGQVDHAKNDLNEQTNTLRLDHADWSAASYIILSTREVDRLPYQLGLLDPDTGVAGSQPDRIFSKEQVNGKVLSKQQLQDEMQFSVNDLDPKTEYFTRVDAKTMSLYRIMSKASIPGSDAAPEQLEAIASGDVGQMKNAGVLQCTDEAKAAFGASAGGCLMVRAFNVDVAPVEVSRQATANGFSSVISFVDSTTSDSDLIRIKLRPNVKKLIKIGDGDLMDPTKTLIVDKMKGKEFLMTRTLTDSPSAFGELFLGNAGKLEIVRFEFLADRVRVVRSKPRVQHMGNNGNDVDAMMSFPATYSILATTDDDGTPLATPKKKDANFNTPGAIAVLDWSKNELPELNSPLDYYEIDQCFDSEQEKEVSEVDYMPDQGLLGYTYTRTYQGSRQNDCAGIYMNSDYFAKYPQTNFRFSERIAFRQYDSSHDSNVLLDMPFEVQQQLGFGVFTNPVVNPDSYGDTDRRHSMQNLAMLWDLKNGKKIPYVLAGLPAADAKDLEGGVTRQDIIDATRSVFKDLNVAMHKALKGSPLERPDSEDILELKIEGDDAPVGHLGDIQRNTIYWVQKQLDSPIWGLAQAQPNPRSGMIETSNVYVYGGNFLSSVPMMKDRAHWEKGYAAVQAAAVAEVTQENSTKAVPVTSEGAPVNKTVAPTTPTQKKTAAYFNALAAGTTPDVAEFVLTHPEQLKFQSTVADKTKLLQTNALSALSLNQGTAKAVALQKVLEQIRINPNLKDSNQVEALVTQNLSDITGGMISQDTASKLKAQAGHAALHGRVMKQLQSMGICLYDRSESGGVTPAGSDVDVTKWSDKDWVLNIYKPTLAHEVGHTLGLRHNFQGSYDKPNWYYADSDSKKRTYSSIMDYMVDDHITYDGMGPYDVAALRAAYTGRVELGDGSLASFDDIKKAANVTNWYDFKTIKPETLKINGQNLRHYAFCTDEDLDGDPTCRQFDHGTTPLEIVNYDIAEYKALYPIHNLPLDKQVFSLDSTGSYVGRLVSMMMPLRRMLEETFFQLNRGVDQKTANLYLSAADRVGGFFNEIIRNPDAPSWAAGNTRRFTPPLSDSKGDVFLLERKAIQDVMVPNSYSDEIAVRGIELDKIVAIQMLTERDFHFPRYERESIQISFPEFERMRNGGDPMGSPTVNLLQEALMDYITPMQWSNTVGLVKMPPAYSVSVTDAMRYFASMAAVVSLDASVINQDLDPSSLFRVIGSSGAPKDVDTAYMPGSFGNAGELVYWAPAGAPAAAQMMGHAVGLAKVLEIQDKLQPLMEEYLADQMKLTLKVQDKAQAQEPAQPPAAKPTGTVENQLDALLAGLPSESGNVQDKDGKPHPMTSAILFTAAKNVLGCYGQYSKLAAAAAKSNSVDDQNAAQEQQEACRNTLTIQSVDVPIVGFMISLFAPSADNHLPMPADLAKVLPSASLLDDSEGMIVSNAKTLDQILVAVHPEVIRNYQ